MTPIDFRAEAHNFTLNDKPFIPYIKDKGSVFLKEEGFHAAVVTLPALASSDLEWLGPISLAKDLIEKGAMIVWEFDFGLAAEKISLTDPALFLSYTLALEQFSRTVWPEFSASSLAAIFYRGNTNFLSRFVWQEHQEKNFSLWYENFFVGGKMDLDGFLGCDKNKPAAEVYCLFVLSEYLHRLLSYLPDSLQVFCLFDVPSEASLAETAQLFSKERFSHFHLAIRNSPIPITGLCYEEGECSAGFLGDKKPVSFSDNKARFAVCLPGDEILFSGGLNDLQNILVLLKENNIFYRIIPESLLTQEWAELEGIICLPSTLTSFGKRSLQGFCAAGGAVISYGRDGGFFEEVSFEEFLEKNRSRGIRTPDLLLPKQPR